VATSAAAGLRRVDVGHVHGRPAVGVVSERDVHGQVTG
jgi:hypothetical protein